MRRINRTVVVIKPKQPLLDWLKQDPTLPPLTLDDLQQDCTAILVPDFYGIKETLEYLEPRKPMLFEMELAGWWTDPQMWPEDRTRDVFDDWFDLEVHSMVWDASDTAIVREDAPELMAVSPRDYPPPIDKLLTYGDARNFRKWPDYVEGLGLGPEHIPDLIRMATDEALNLGDPESLEVWAPTHAWRALGQLRAEEAIEPLMRLFHELKSDEWIIEELPDVYGMIGPAALPALADYLADESHGVTARATAALSLERIGSAHPDARAECVAILSRRLERFAENDPGLNGFLIVSLLGLQAVESVPVMERAFAADRVNEWMVSWDFVQRELGVEVPQPKQADKPRRRRRRRRRKR